MWMNQFLFSVLINIYGSNLPDVQEIMKLIVVNLLVIFFL